MPYKKEFITIKEMLEAREVHGSRCGAKEIANEYYSRLKKGEHSNAIILDLMQRLNKSRVQILTILKKGEQRLEPLKFERVTANVPGRLS